MNHAQRIGTSGSAATNWGTPNAKTTPNWRAAIGAVDARKRSRLKKKTANWAGTRSHGLSPKAAMATTPAAKPSVVPANIWSAFLRVATMSGWFVSRMLAIVSRIDGGRSVSPRSTAIVHAAVTRSAPRQRAGLTATSEPRGAARPLRAGAAGAPGREGRRRRGRLRGSRLAEDSDDRAHAHPRRMGRVVRVHPDAHREPAREPDPVQGRLHLRQHADGRAVLRLERPADALHDAVPAAPG